MDVSFSAKPQTLTLTSCASLSTSKLTSIRRQFLGCAHNLRPPGTLRSRRKLKNGGHALPSRFIFRASLDSNSILNVVAVVTFSAVSVVYWSHHKRKTDVTVREVSQFPNLAISQLGRAINWIIESDWEQYKVVTDGIEQNTPSKKEEMVLQFQNSVSLQEEASITSTLQLPGSDVLTSLDNGSALSIELEATDPSHSDVVFESSAVQPFVFANSTTGLQLEGSSEKIDSYSDFPAVVDKSNFSHASFTVTEALTQVIQQHKADNELIQEGKFTSFNSFLEEIAREDIYMFYEAKTNSSGERNIYSHTSLQNSSRFSSLMTNSALDGARLTTDFSLQTAGHVEGKMTGAVYNGDHLWGRINSGKDNGFSRGKERTELSQNNNELLHGSPHPNGVHVKDKKQPSEHLKTYNYLLRDGRVRECVELLEKMERKGLLDMNKIYHARFFNTCKGKKAVEEAFRYTNLIPNPTLSTFNMLMSVCASSQDLEGAFKVLQFVQESGMKADCKLYTTLISTCAKCGKVETMFEVFHGMVNTGVKPNVHTYGALVDGCARAGQVAKAFGVYGLMRSKNVKPDRVVFNALITACGQSGTVDRAFDVVAEMRADTHPIDPDHVTVGALMRACSNAGQVDRAREVYKMIHKYDIKGTPEVYTIALNCCSQSGDWEFACSVYEDMSKKGVLPDEMFISALIDVAGHAGKLDAAFEIVQEARTLGINVGIVSYSSLMGACSNAKNWKKALELYDDLKSIKLKPTVSTINALITALCDGDQLQKAVEVLSEMKGLGLCPNSVTYSILFVASEKKDDSEIGLELLSQTRKDGIALNLAMSGSIIGMCLRRFEKACTLGEPVMSLDSGLPQLDNKWTSATLMVYREKISAGLVPSSEVLSQVLGCLQLPYDGALKNRLIENLGLSLDSSRNSNLCSLVDGFGEYDPRAFSLVEEAASLGLVPCVSFKGNPIIVDVRNLQIHTAEVYLLTVLKGLKHRLAAGAKLPNVTVLLPVETTQMPSTNGDMTVNLAGMVGQVVGALLRRLDVPYQGNESLGKIKMNGLSLRRWFQPKLPYPFSGKPEEFRSSQSRLGKGISHQQRDIRTGNLSLD